MFKKLQEEQRAWVKHNFGDRPAWHPLMGAIEELGELAHHHLKEAQGIRNHEDHIAEAKDAVADIVIYLSDYCTAVNINLDEVMREQYYGVIWQNEPMKHIFVASHSLGVIAYEDVYQMGSPFSTIKSTINNLKSYCLLRGWNFEAIVQATWDKVKKRDWKKNPDKAHEG